MARYRVEFRETSTYEVEFDYDGPVLDPTAEEEADGEPWFKAMDAAKPNWSTTNIVAVEDREIISLDIVDPEPSA